MELESRSPCHQDILYHMFIHETIFVLPAAEKAAEKAAVQTVSKHGRFYVVSNVSTRRETGDDLIVFLAGRGVFSVFAGGSKPDI